MALVRSRGGVAAAAGTGMVSQVETVGLPTVPHGLLGTPFSHFHSPTDSPPSSSCTSSRKVCPTRGSTTLASTLPGSSTLVTPHGNPQAANAGAVVLLVGLDGHPIVVVAAGVSGLFEVWDSVEGEDTATAEYEVLAVGAGQLEVDTPLVRIRGAVCSQRSVDTSAFLKLQSAFAAHHWRLVHVLDCDGDINGVCAAARVGGSHHDSPGCLFLVVELDFGAQLTGGSVDFKVYGVINAISQPVVVTVSRGYRCATFVPARVFSRMLRS